MPVEKEMRQHRSQPVPVFRVREGDQVEIAGWPAMVKYSEPYSEFLWSITVDGHFRDGDPFTSTITLPADVRVQVRRKPTRKEHDND